MIAKNYISFGHNNRIVGEITERQKYYIKVNIIHPYSGWENSSSMMGHSRMTKQHFLTDYGDKTAQRLLKESHEKLKIIDKSFERIVSAYHQLQKQLLYIDKFDNVEMKESIKYRLQEYFYHDVVFVSSVTGLIVSQNERKIIEEIFRIYRLTGRKIFLSSNN